MSSFLKRREFLTKLPCALGGVLVPLVALDSRSIGQNGATRPVDGACWLDVSAPFIVEDNELGIHSEIILTSDTFSGVSGHADRADSTEYEVYLYDVSGKAVGADGVAKRITAPAMHTTVLPVRDLVGASNSFLGGLRVRLRPRARTPMHASDLFSSAFVRWTTDASFDNVHANPDPLEWQRPGAFFYSMPFPPLRDYDCFYSLFNPYGTRTSGEVVIHDPRGKALKKIPYDIKGRSSIFLDLATGEPVSDTATMFGISDGGSTDGSKTSNGGTVAVTNAAGSVKNFGYLLIKRRNSVRFSIDHPIHQSPFNPTKAKVPVDSEGRFKAKNILYTPLLFNSKRIAGITLDTRFHLSSGAPMEEFLWLSPFVTDADGNVPWESMRETKFRGLLPPEQTESGIIKLGAKQSCMIDCSAIGLRGDFSGGLSLAISPTSNHTLMKAEVRVREWGAHAFTHFRPGLAAARGYQKPSHRGGLMTDYITSGARLVRENGRLVHDEIVCIMNIDDKGVTGKPVLEVFSSAGLITNVPMGDVPPFACRHYLLSDLIARGVGNVDLSLRLVDTQATLLMSIVHIDHARRDIALDHGSDRFSTFTEFTCDPAGM